MKKEKLGPNAVVLLRLKEEDQKTESGIIIPGTKKETRSRGQVILAGTGTKATPMEVKPGDIVHYETLKAANIEDSGMKLDLIDSMDCLFIEG